MAKEKTDIVLVNAATYDELTQILNRRTFYIRTEEKIDYLRKIEKPISFMLLDLDEFKIINDTYGHLMGDEVIKDFVATVKTVLDHDAIFGRIGGEEFTIALPDISSAGAYVIADNIRDAVSRRVLEDTIRYTVSIGLVTVIPGERTSVEHLYRISDSALYAAKRNGRNCVEVEYNTLE